MIPFTHAINLLHKYGLEQDRITHSMGVSELAYSLARMIKKRHPGLGVDPERVKIAALLHDIGRSRKGHHETNSVAILKKEGLHELVDIVLHGTLYEEKKMNGIDDPTLLPRSVENKIVAYADTRFRLNPVSLEERIEEVKKRRKHETDKIRAVTMAIPRIKKLEREVLGLAGMSEHRWQRSSTQPTTPDT